ncbi:MAG: amidophosphoribosyltransferase, partial [Candidatus Methanospirareceae archaeon]
MRGREKCGIVGISLPEDDVATSLFYALYALQHRGQESAGIAVSTSKEKREDRDIFLKKGMGFVYKVFDSETLEALKGNVGIGHVRYSTTGASTIENAQPLLVNYKKGKIAIAHNGNLVNADVLRRKLVREGRIFHTDSDTEVIAQLLVKELMRHDIEDAIKELTKQLVGSYSLVILIDGRLIAIRDPLGFKPLCIGEIKGG